MPSLQQRIANLERTAAAHIAPNTEPIGTLGEFMRVSQRVSARHRHPSRSCTTEEDVLAKSDHLRLLDCYKNGTVLALFQAFEEAYTQGPDVVERFLQMEGFTVEEGHQFQKEWTPATHDTTVPDDGR